MKQLVAAMLLITLGLVTQAIADSKEEVNEKLRASGLVGADQAILITSNVYFYPNKKGFGMFSGGRDREKGFIIFTDQGFMVVSWSRKDKTYDVLYKVDYGMLDSSEIMGNSPMVRLVTKEKDSKKHNSFEIMDSRNAFAPNPEKTKEAKDIIKAGIEGLDVTAVASADSLSAVQTQEQQKRLEELEARLERLENAEEGAAVEVSSECDCKCPE